MVEKRERHHSEHEKDERVSRSSLTASQSKQQRNVGRQAGLWKSKASMEERTRRVFQWAAVTLGVMRRVTPGVKCVLPAELQPCQQPGEEIIFHLVLIRPNFPQ